MLLAPLSQQHVLPSFSVSLTHQALFARSVRGEGARVGESLSAMLAVEGLLPRVDSLVFLKLDGGLIKILNNICISFLNKCLKNMEYEVN